MNNQSVGWSDFSKIVELDPVSFNLSVSAAEYATLYLDFNAIIPEGIFRNNANKAYLVLNMSLDTIDEEVGFPIPSVKRL